ncbi:MAG: DUF2946 family protein [Hyphomicrobiaceae bacterium]
MLILFVVLKALVPVGYMPDLSGGLAASPLVICSVSGTTTMTLDETGNPLGEQHRAQPDEMCPFGAISDQQLLTHDQPRLPAPEFATVFVTAATRAILPPVRAGPVLGSRAPPSNPDC